MIYSDFKYFSAPTSSSLGLGYLYSQEDIQFLIASGSSGSIINFPFGESNKDLVEFYVYTLDGDIITSSYGDENEAEAFDVDDYTYVTRSYIDVTNKAITYSYSLYQSDFNVTDTATHSLIFNIDSAFSSSGIQEGNYKIGILPVRNVVGEPYDTTQRLLIDEISPSRTEVAVIPHSKRITSDIDEQRLNTEFELFSNSKIQPKLILNRLVDRIKSPQLYQIYIDTATANPDADSLVKYYYSFKNDASLVGFITDIYYGVLKGSLKNNGQIATGQIFGIYDQYSNFLYQNYESITTFQELKDYYYSLFLYILDTELNQITNKKPTDYDTVVAFFRHIFYDLIFFPAISITETEYEVYFSGYLKNSMNFGNGRLLPILNFKASPSSDPSISDRLILKLRDPLPTDINVSDSFWISCISVTTPVVQNVYYYSNVDVPVFQLRGPNFNFKIENEGSGTQNLSIDTIMGATGSLGDEISSSMAYKSNVETPLNTDYRYFENFARFSSVYNRLQVYGQKVASIADIRNQLIDLNSLLSLNQGDPFYIKQIDDLNIKWNELEGSFDAYEMFLQENPAWYSEHTKIYDGVTSASRYDADNRGSLQNNLPEFIADNPANGEYITFVNMLGHYFDNLMLYIDQFTEKNNATNSENQGISKDVVYDMLTSLGWHPEMGRENLPLLLSAFSKNDFDVDSDLWNLVGDLSEDDRNKFIWKRILNNLPFILKAKGTEAAIDALISCYGIPRNLIQIREYGGIDYSTELNNDSRFIFDETKYSPYFSGSGEYFQVPWSGSVQSVEFNFTFDTNRISTEGKIFRLMTIGDRAAVGIVREKGNDWGRAFFTIQNTGSNLITVSTQRAPFFDGNTYSLLLRKNNLSTDFNLPSGSSTSVTDPYPQQYELIVKRNEDNRTTFQVQTDVFLSGSFNTSFSSASYVYFGNYLQNTASLNLGPESFYGTLDEIRLWEDPISDDKFNSHASYRGSYDLEDPRTVVSALLARISFSTPQDLNDPSGTSIISNANFKNVFPNLFAVNFPLIADSVLNSADCQVYISVPRYPYQFQKIEMIQSVNLPNFGANKFKSNKIKYKNQILASNLSPDSRSTLKSSQDSDVDSNKLGVFFSPGELINTEIMKFFGNFQLGDLIGNPSDVYEKTYKRFNRFREVFYNQGGGQVDYQTFMNLVRAYFDKSLFKYIENLVPARAKLVEGLLIEPTILERPKLQLKPVSVSVPNNFFSSTETVKGLSSEFIPAFSQSLQIGTSGIGLNDDIKRTFYSDDSDRYGFSISADNGTAYYQGDYYRVDKLHRTGSVIYQLAKRLPLASATSSFDIQSNGPDRGQYLVVKKYWNQVSVAKFPMLMTIPFDSSLTLRSINDATSSLSTTFSFTGSLSGSGLIPSMGSTFISAPLVFNGQATAANVISSSVNSGSIFLPLGLQGTMTAGTASLTGTYNSVTKIFSGSFTLKTGAAFTGSFYSLDPKVSVANYMLKTTTGNLFSYLRNTELANRKGVAALNIPYNSTALNGYYHTHFKYKKSIFSKKRLKLFATNSQTIVGYFKRGSQTQKTTIQSGSGLFDNSLPIVITTS